MKKEKTNPPFWAKKDAIIGVVFINGDNPAIDVTHKNGDVTHLRAVIMANGDLWFSTTRYPTSYKLSDPNVMSVGINAQQYPPKETDRG